MERDSVGGQQQQQDRLAKWDGTIEEQLDEIRDWNAQLEDELCRLRTLMARIGALFTEAQPPVLPTNTE